ncbi:MAG: nucleotidyl transferase AbiEii/AbiGii toxin family protein [Deltaproteobacteria bacterium]|nr:nucleotidyl transferase AbiEii/AbiGii toxin family protein [Deltaproteobacteria bacterium]
MKQEMIKRIKKGGDQRGCLNLLREELQHLVLQELERKGAFKDLCFLGGTALRILFGLDRFSEDLDFSTSRHSKKFDIAPLSKSIHQGLLGYGFENQITKLKTKNNVQSFFISFLPFKEIKIGFPVDQKLAIKLEVDTHPPAGADETVSPVSGVRLYKIRHYTLPSLFAGKMHALLYRRYTKGRDLYDFLWYTSKSVPINKTMIENAAAQSQKKDISFTVKSLRAELLKRLESIDFKQAKNDVGPFVKDEASLSLFEFELFKNAVERVGFEVA